MVDRTISSTVFVDNTYIGIYTFLVMYIGKIVLRYVLT